MTKTTNAHVFFGFVFLTWNIYGNTATEIGCLNGWGGAGHATYYTSNLGVGACTIGFNSAIDPIAALPVALWNGSGHCGECLKLTGALGSVVVKVVDQCPECQNNQLDLSPAAFAQLDNPAVGITSISWQSVECATTGYAQYRLQGSNPYYVKIQILGTPSPAKEMYLQGSGTNNSVHATLRSDDNFFVYQETSSTGLAAPLKIHAIDINGASIHDAATSITSTSIQTGTRQFPPCHDVVFSNDFDIP